MHTHRLFRAALLGAVAAAPLAAHAQAPAQCSALDQPAAAAVRVAQAVPAQRQATRDVVASPPPVAPPPGLDEVPSAVLARLPALRNIADAGAKLYELPALPGGTRTFFALAGTRFQVFYVPGNGDVAIRGIAQDATGRNITLDQVKDIPGVTPTVEIRDGAPLVDGSALKTVATTTTHALWGRPGAPRVYAFVDPLCSFSLRMAEALRPHVDAGRVQVALIPVAVIDHETGGKSTTTALTMLAGDRDRMATDWLASWRTWAAASPGHVPDQVLQQLRANQAAAGAIGLKGTPTLLWARPDGTEARADGAPGNIDTFVAELGG